MTLDIEEHILHSPPIGFAHHHIVLDDFGKAVDYEFFAVNSTFEKLTELDPADLPHRIIRQIIPGFEKTGLDWIGVFGAVALGLFHFCSFAISNAFFPSSLRRYFCNRLFGFSGMVISIQSRAINRLICL
jgi:hypothetical protein